LDAEFESAYRASKKSYELGRVAGALRRAAFVGALVALLTGVLFGKHALGWLPLTFLIVAASEWHGRFLMQGARRGVLAGVLAMLLPLSLLRPCCGIDAKAMGIDCCVMPSMCWAVGAATGLAMALFLPKAPEGKRLETTLGMLGGVLSVAVLRCSPLFVGEALGLLGGVSLGVVAVACARARLETA
jgi:hypothetical protein